MALVSVEDLELYIQRQVNPGSADVAIRVAEGWLRSATRIVDWPYPVPPDLFSWCIELAAIAYSNPDGLETLTVGPTTRGWALARKSEILADAGRQYSGGAGGPQFSFPPVDPYPGARLVR